MIINTKIETPAMAEVVESRPMIEGLAISAVPELKSVQASQSLLAGISIEP